MPGADGFSFSYGDLPAGPIGELGAGDGLRICWRTHSLQRLELWYEGEQLESIAPPQVLSEATIREGTVVPGTLGEGSLRSDSFVSVEVANEL